jgi:NAD(P)-dependent dehydrogenase (short-subunit alcohol dehydrogenase family)
MSSTYPDLTGKTVVITGGSRGIGAQIVLDVYKAGHDVAFTFLRSQQQADAVVEQARALRGDGKCLAYQLDVRDSAATEAVAERALEALGGMDVVVPNAGVNLGGLLVSMSDEEWREVIDTNLTGAFHVCRQLLPALMMERFGRIIFISSVGQSGGLGQAAYSASKAGLRGLSAAISKEYGRKGITSNVLVLGVFDTDMTRDGLSERNREFWSSYCPAGRTGALSEVSEAVLFLASDGAAFVNGAELRLTGGLDWTP